MTDIGLADITAAPSTLEMGGKVYTVSPLQDRDYGEFERWVQDRYLDVATRNVDKIPSENREAFLQHAYDTAAEITIHSDRALSLMVTVEGSAFLLWLSVRRDHPEATYEEVLRFATDPKTLQKAMEKVEQLNTPLGKEERSPRIGRRAGARAATRRR